MRSHVTHRSVKSWNLASFVEQVFAIALSALSIAETTSLGVNERFWSLAM